MERDLILGKSGKYQENCMLVFKKFSPAVGFVILSFNLLTCENLYWIGWMGDWLRQNYLILIKKTVYKKQQGFCLWTSC